MNATGRRHKEPLIRAGLAAVVLAAALVGPSFAESPMSGLGTTTPFVGGVAVRESYPFRASTAGESFARGAAEVIRSQGEFNLNTSEAAINAQEAFSRALVNAQDAVETYFKLREMNRDYRRALRGLRPTSEELQRYSRAAQPAPLSPSELDTLTGQVNWPILLRDDRFASLRAEYEELLDRWAVSRNLGRTDGFGTEQHLAVRRTTDKMEERLREAVRNLHPQDYAVAKQFLRSLEYQVLRPGTSSVSVASAR